MLIIFEKIGLFENLKIYLIFYNENLKVLNSEKGSYLLL